MPQTDRVGPLKEIVNLRLVLWAILFVSPGGLALYLSTRWSEPWQTLIRNLGSAFVVTGALTITWNFLLKRAFLDEVLEKAGIATELKSAGIFKITHEYVHGVNWKSLFEQVQKLDLFFAYGRTWRHVYNSELTTLAKTPGVQIRVVLPNPKNDETVAELARRFRCTPDEIRSRVDEAYRYFCELAPDSDSAPQVQIWFLPAAPQFAFYLFDRFAVITLYTHRKERTHIPTFVVKKGGSLYDFIRQEFDAMVKEGGLATRVFPPGPPSNHASSDACEPE